MARANLASALKQVERGEPDPIYYLTGEEEVRKEEFVEALTDLIVDPSTRDFNLEARRATDLDAEGLSVLLDTPPVLASVKLVILRGVDQWRKNSKVWKYLLEYARGPSQTTVLILIHSSDKKTDGELGKLSTHLHVEPLKPKQVTKWIVDRAEKRGLHLSEAAAGHLAAAVGYSLATLRMELDKIAAAVPDPNRTELGPEDVSEFVGVRYGETVFDWVDSVIGRDTKRSLDLLDRVLPQAGVTGVRLVMSLGSALVGVRLAVAVFQAGRSRGQVEQQVFDQIRKARLPGLRNWREEARRWTEAAKHWPIEDLERAMRAAAEADRALKSTTLSDDSAILKNMVLEIATGRTAA